MSDATELVAIIGATLIDGNGGVPVNDAVLLISGKRIVAVGDGSTRIPPEARQIAVQGKFVIPGLMAMNVYLADATWVPLAITYEGRYDEVAIEGAQLALRGGVTTVFDSWGPRDALIKARDSINQGTVTAARIYVCGNWVGIGGPFSDDMRPQFRAAVGEPFARRINSQWETNIGEDLVRMLPEDVRREVRKYVESGVDYLTYPVNVHRMGVSSFIVFSSRVQRVIVEEGHRAGLSVRACFATTEEGIHLALDAGADIVAPAPLSNKPVSAETIALIARKRVPCMFEAPAADELEWHRHNANPAFPGLRELVETTDRDVRAFIEAGAPVLSGRWGGLYSADQVAEWAKNAGGQAGMAQLDHGQVLSLSILLQKGMRPMDALMAATRNVAQAFKVDKELGTLEQGKFADLVILDNNPLENVEHYRRIHLIMKEGKVIDRSALPTQRLLTAPRTE